VIDAYRSACDDAGREPGEVILQTGMSWAEDDDDALEGATSSAPDPGEHAARIREVELLGATIVCVQNASGADPLGALRTYGKRVLRALTGVAV
jgi:coenzyme F420-dependent glucose-6-phosphate dehydrogenase